MPASASLISAARARVWVCVVAFALGIYAASLTVLPAPLWFSITLAACALAAAFAARRWWFIHIVLAMFSAGGGWYTQSVHDFPARSALIYLDPASGSNRDLPTPSTLVHARVRFLETPRQLQPASGLLAGFAIRQGGARALASLLELEVSPGTFQPVRGNITISIAQQSVPHPDLAGRTAQILGFFSPWGPSTNPGESDRRAPSLDRGTIGIINCSSWDVVTLLPPPSDLTQHYYHFTQSLRDRAIAIVSSAATTDSASSHPNTSNITRALLLALLLGEQDPLLRDTYDLFARAGLVHILSISGFHLGLMAWLALLALRLTGDRGWLEPLIVGVLVVLYSLILPPQSPLLRSAAMVLTLLAVQATGRRYDHVTLLGWITIGLLIWRPSELWSLGFSLSVGLTAVLFWLADDFTYILARPPLRGTIRFRERPPLDRARHALYAAVSSNILCWIVSLPLLISTVGIISPSGIILSILLTPLFIAVLALGYTALLLGLTLGWFFPGIEGLAAGLIERLLTLSIATVTLTDTLPLAYLRIPPTPLLWAIITTPVLLVWARALGRARAGHTVHAFHANQQSVTTKPTSPPPPSTPLPIPTPLPPRLNITRAILNSPLLSGCAALALFLVLPFYWHASQQLPSSTLVRIDMLDVGNGTCILLRARDHAGHTHTIMWDCGTLGGTSGGPHNAARTIVQAARALNITTIPTVIISHPDLDHFGALPQLLEPLGVRTVIVPPRFVTQAAQSPTGAPGLVLDLLKQDNVILQTAVAGDSIMFGDLALTFISPPAHAPFQQDNDHSLVAALTNPQNASMPLVLFTGDIDREAITYIRAAHPEHTLTPLVLELPHHGSAKPPAIDWVTALKPRIILQSTGRSRANDPRWSTARTNLWHCTALDGSAHITIHTDHTLTATSYLRGTRTQLLP